MKHALLLLLFLAVSLGASAQNKKKPAKKAPVKTTASATSAVLYQKWIHSYEDENGQATGVEVYRPESYAFPPSRGRKAVKFSKDGMLIRFDIGPSDGHKIVMARWEPTKLSNTLKVTVQGAESSAYFVEVVSVSNNQLKIRRKLEI